MMSTNNSKETVVESFSGSGKMGDVLGKASERQSPNVHSIAENELNDADPTDYISIHHHNISVTEQVPTTDEEDYSWVLCLNTEDFYKNCNCQGCLRRFISFTSEEKNAKQLINAWRELKTLIRKVYNNPPLDAVRTNQSLFEDNERLRGILQWLHMTEPFQLLQKIEGEVINIVIESRSRLLSIIKNDESEPEVFATGLIEEYVKLLSSAVYLGPAMDELLGPQLEKFRLTWDVLNKHLYLSLIYLHQEVQDMWPVGFNQLKKCLNSEDDFYHELYHQFITLDHEMNLVDAAWKRIEPLIQEFRKLKSRESSALRNLQAALKVCFSRKQPMSLTGNDEGNECPHSGICPTSRTLPRQQEDGSEHDCKCHTCPGLPKSLISSGSSLPALDSKLKCSGKVLSTDEGNVNKATTRPHHLPVNGSSCKKSPAGVAVYCVSRSNPCLSSEYSHLYSVLSNSLSHNDGSQEIPSLLMKALTGSQFQSKFLPPLKDNKIVMPPIFIPKNYPVKSAGNLTPEQLALITKTMEREKSVESPSEPCASDTMSTPPIQDSAPRSDVPNSSVNENLTAKERALVKKALHQALPRRKLPTQEEPSKPGTSCTKPSAPCQKPTGSCLKPGVCGKCSKSGNTDKCKNAEKHLAAIARLGLSKYSSRCPHSTRCSEHTHTAGKTHAGGMKSKSSDELSNNKQLVQGDPDCADCDDSSSQDDSCSERSNSTSTSNSNTALKDPKHCDCCYCEVFGHGVTAATVSRNYQEMRERLRLRLNMKKKSTALSQQSATSSTAAGNVSRVPNMPTVHPSSSESCPTPSKEEDLDSLLQFIEGNRRDERIDEKKLAKRARQKQKKQEEREEKERQEREAERLRLEALKKMSKKNRKAARAMVQAPAQTPKPENSFSRLKSLVERTAVSNTSEPKMVTIRRVMEPFGAEPTVTITIKGSSPDKDEVLFSLESQNSPAAVPSDSIKSKKKKSKKSDEEVALKNVPAVHQKRVLEIINESKSKRNKQEVEKCSLPAHRVEKQPQVPFVKPCNALKDATRTAKAAFTPVSSPSSDKVQSGVNERWKSKEPEVTVRPVTTASSGSGAVYRLSEVLSSISHSAPPPREEIKLENLRLPPGITITKIEGPKAKTIRASDDPGPVSRPTAAAPPLLLSHGAPGRVLPQQATIKPTPAGNVIVVDTGRLKQVMKENGIPTTVTDVRPGDKKKKKKKSKGVGEVVSPPVGLQQATIIKTSDNMVTIRSPQLQRAIDMQAVNGLGDRLRGLDLDAAAGLEQQMTRLSLADARAALPLTQEPVKKKKKRKGKGWGADEDVEQPENVFKPKDIDLENGDIDDDERELEAFKRFCLQSVPPERKDKVKVNLNIKDIVLKKKSTAIGCS